MEKPFPGLYFPPTSKATMAEGEKVLALTLNQAVIPTITLFNFFESCRLEDF